MRPSTRIAIAGSWLVFILVSGWAWQQLPPWPYRDTTRLFLAELAGGTGLLLVGWWAAARDRAR